MRKNHWTDDADTARHAIAFANTRTLSTLREGNDKKARLLVCALVGQVTAITFLALGVFAVLLDGT
jgi:hypothetical protein